MEWWKQYGRNFPWREEFLSEYELIIAEILLQRTKAETIANYYMFFLNSYPGWESLAAANENDLATLLRPIGLYNQRAKRIFALAKSMEQRDFIIPQDRESIDKIPFMGQYIANAVELLILNRAKPLLDVNMARVLERYFGPRQKADIRYDPYLQSLAHDILKGVNAKEINWAILDFAALICQSKKPKCSICSLSESCRYYKNNKI
ncbi:A/G-specific DNA-adenine glycosylase [Mucilaginibacter gossypii]|uniref:A/G-specific DNA-adenine glycosylase n=2 Tax=Mucilaginibacter gossypii TaxID=551996 RepID=A0A1G8CY94_9SPHI|nr:A/G-specific DNA-adenine glycosylase [Mucilaginibacter gossypii]